MQDLEQLYTIPNSGIRGSNHTTIDYLLSFIRNTNPKSCYKMYSFFHLRRSRDLLLPPGDSISYLQDHDIVVIHKISDLLAVPFNAFLIETLRIEICSWSLLADPRLPLAFDR